MVLARFWKDQSGASASEYALIVAVVGPGIGAAALVLGANAKHSGTSMESDLASTNAVAAVTTNGNSSNSGNNSGSNNGSNSGNNGNGQTATPTPTPTPTPTATPTPTPTPAPTPTPTSSAPGNSGNAPGKKK